MSKWAYFFVDVGIVVLLCSIYSVIYGERLPVWCVGIAALIGQADTLRRLSR